MFSGCESVKEFIIPEDVVTIDEEAFSGCSSLEKVTIPSTVEIISAGAFKNCKSLEEILFEGTKEDWEANELGDDWNKGIAAMAVKCVNGYVWF